MLCKKENICFHLTTDLFLCHIDSSHMTIFTNKFTENKTVLSRSTSKVQNCLALNRFWRY